MTLHRSGITPVQRSHGLQRLGNELHDFVARVLPRLTDPEGPERLPFFWAAQAMANNAFGLSQALAGHATPCEEAALPTNENIHEAVRDACRSQQGTAKNNLLMRRTLSADERVACRWDGRQVVWSLAAMSHPVSAEILNEHARELARRLGVQAHDAPELRIALREIPDRRLVDVFRHMQFDVWYWFAHAIARIYPEVPDKVFLLPTGRHGRATTVRSLPDSPGVTGPVSYLLGMAMEIRANNHFGRVWKTAARPEIHGSWRPLMPGQVLEILYRKWQVLSEECINK
jgi:hypothetical protein